VGLLAGRSNARSLGREFPAQPADSEELRPLVLMRAWVSPYASEARLVSRRSHVWNCRTAAIRADLDAHPRRVRLLTHFRPVR
jgi:hypothetical protein